MVAIALDVALLLFGLIGMEGVAWFTHRYLMHGPLWVWHRSHHEPRRGVLELNDLFVVVFATPSIVLIALGASVWPPGLWLGLGMTGYGAIYALFHDGIVHRRFPVPAPRRLLRRLIQAHRLHHAVHERTGAVSFGFLWAPSPQVLKQRLRAMSSAPGAEAASSTARRDVAQAAP